MGHVATIKGLVYKPELDGFLVPLVAAGSVLSKVVKLCGSFPRIGPGDVEVALRQPLTCVCGSESGHRVEGFSVCAVGVNPESTCGRGLQATQCTQLIDHSLIHGSWHIVGGGVGAAALGPGRAPLSHES